MRVDQVLTQSDNIFYRFSMSRAPSTIPATFPGLADGGGFFTGVGDNRLTQSPLVRRTYFLQHVSMRFASAITAFIRIDSSSTPAPMSRRPLDFPASRTRQAQIMADCRRCTSMMCLHLGVQHISHRMRFRTPILCRYFYSDRA